MTVPPDEGPAPAREAAAAIGASISRSATLLRSRQVHLATTSVGSHIAFADGTGARVFRETFVDVTASSPCALVVTFRLLLVRGALHQLFEIESICNTPLFVGFPGLVSKLWLGHDEQGRYRGLYEWDSPELAAHYARCLSWFLGIVSVRGSIHYRVVPNMRRDELVAGGASAAPSDGGGGEWWRPVPST